MMDYPRLLFTELNLGKFPDSMEFQSWKVNFRTEITMHWIKEVEIAKSIDELVTWRLIVEHDFLDFDMLDQHADTFPKESKCRRAACSKKRPVLTRKTNCVHDLRVFPCNRSL